MISKIIYDFDVEEGVPKNVNTQITSVIKPLSLRKSYFCYNCSQNIGKIIKNTEKITIFQNNTR